MRKLILALAAPVLLTACEGTGANVGGHLAELPPRIQELAAPHQDLRAVKLDPATYCYVYLHRGPVEDTYLPLRTRRGRPICAEKPASTQPAAKS
ncbi:MAG: hypothetical protein CSA85_00360 [Alphaproteobacteria bacterium]|nr:MAG: hypothetical protein CSA85_00360 [Alphaproteobacteria bacterium]